MELRDTSGQETKTPMQIRSKFVLHGLDATGSGCVCEVSEKTFMEVDGLDTVSVPILVTICQVKGQTGELEVMTDHASAVRGMPGLYKLCWMTSSHGRICKASRHAMQGNGFCFSEWYCFNFCF